MNKNLVDFSKYTKVETSNSTETRDNIKLFIPKKKSLIPNKSSRISKYTRLKHFKMKLMEYMKLNMNINKEHIEYLKDKYNNGLINNIKDVIKELKNLNEIKYYKHCFRLLIFLKYNDDNKYFLDKKDQVNIVTMFKLINLYFENYNKEFKISLSLPLPYNYIIYKCLQLRKLNILPWDMYFCSSKKIIDIWDKKWKVVCDEFKWNFVNTV